MVFVVNRCTLIDFGWTNANGFNFVSENVEPELIKIQKKSLFTVELVYVFH